MCHGGGGGGGGGHDKGKASFRFGVLFIILLKPARHSLCACTASCLNRVVCTVRSAVVLASRTIRCGSHSHRNTFSATRPAAQARGFAPAARTPTEPEPPVAPHARTLATYAVESPFPPPLPPRVLSVAPVDTLCSPLQLKFLVREPHRVLFSSLTISPHYLSSAVHMVKNVLPPPLLLPYPSRVMG